MAALNVIEINDVSKRFVIHKDKSLKERVVNFRRSQAHREDFWALRGVTLEIEAGTTVGLIGPNGSGKSTLLKTIGGIIQPTSGNVMLRGRLAALLELGAGFHPDLTGRENVYLNAAILGLTQSETDRHFDAIVDFSGIEQFIDTQVKFYSSGMYVRLAFAIAVHVNPDILLVDEVLAVGDEPFQRKCMDRIRSFQAEGRTIVLVTHALGQVTEVCDRAIVLDHGQVIADGPPRDSLRTLRQEYDQTRQEDVAAATTSAVEATPASGDAGPAAEAEAATVTAVRVLDTAGEPVQTMHPGDTVVVRVDVNAETTITEGYVGIAVENTMGVLLYGTNTLLQRVPLAPLLGPSSYEFTLPELALGDGSYVIHAAVSSSRGVELHRLRDGALLQCAADDSSIGLVWTNASITVLDPA